MLVQLLRAFTGTTCANCPFLKYFYIFLEILIKIGSFFHQAQLPMVALPVLVLNLNSLTRFADEKVS